MDDSETADPEMPDPEMPASTDTSPEHGKKRRLPKWLTAEGVRRVLVISGIVIFVLITISVPVPWIVNWVSDQLHDREVLYNPKKEGLIAVSSPQLFTRERLINQRMEESAWIDSRIAAVADMIEKKRFLKPTDIRSVKEDINFTLQTQDTGDDDRGSSLPLEMINNLLEKDPLSEFKAANSYRQKLVQEKFQSILDDAHDTYSNTLQRLNFNLTISPALDHSTSVAAVSVTLEQPKDPEWIMQKYGELLNDVRDELQQTAQRMIDDRKSIFRMDTDYFLNAQANDLLIAEVKHLSKGYDYDWRSDVEERKKATLDQHQATMLQSFQTYLQSVGDDPAIGSALIDIFFQSSGPPRGSQIPKWPSDWNGLVPISMIWSALANDWRRSSTPPPDISALANKLESTCNSGSASIWSLFPSGTPERASYKRLEKAFVAFSGAKASREPAEGRLAKVSLDEIWKLDLRELLSEKSYSAPCPPAAQQIGQIALLELLGDLNQKNAYKQDWMKHCSPENKRNMSKYKGDDFKKETREGEGMQKPILGDWAENFEDPGDFRRKCGAHRQSLLEIGVAHLVHAELNNTPIDTAGRIRHLDNYFSVDKDNCDLNSCQLIVRTISEGFRYAGLHSLNSQSSSDWTDWLKEETSDCLDEQTRAFRLDRSRRAEGIRQASKRVDQCALIIGRQEALRLFAELSCFASARSYTVYPREGVGDSILEQDSRGWSLSSFFGQNMVSATRASERAHVMQSVPILGLGDIGDHDRDRAIECGASFLAILNNINVKDDLTKYFSKLIYGKSKINVGFKWKQLMHCLLDAAKSGKQVLESANCPSDSPKFSLVKFDLKELTMVVRHLRQRETTISWIVNPKNEGFLGSRHIAQSIPLSAIVSLPSWWPGVRIATETCWIRPKRMHAESGRSLCLDEKPLNSPNELSQRARRHAAQMLPLPSNVEDVLPKLGFFLIRYPYLDHFNSSDISLESGREVQLRLTGKRLWKNPMVRIGEQWHTKVEVLPDMRGVVATFKCLAPLTQRGKNRRVVRQAATIRLTSSKIDDNDHDKDYVDGGPAKAENQDFEYAEQRPVQVWTSEGNTSQITVTVHAFRPNYRLDGMIEVPCWANEQIDKIRMEKEAKERD